MAERRTSTDAIAERDRILAKWDSRIVAQREQAEAEPAGGWTIEAVEEAFEAQVELDRVHLRVCAVPAKITSYADFGMYGQCLLFRANFKYEVNKLLRRDPKTKAQQVVLPVCSGCCCASELMH